MRNLGIPYFFPKIWKSKQTHKTGQDKTRIRFRRLIGDLHRCRPDAPAVGTWPMMLPAMSVRLSESHFRVNFLQLHHRRNGDDTVVCRLDHYCSLRTEESSLNDQMDELPLRGTMRFTRVASDPSFLSPRTRQSLASCPHTPPLLELSLTFFPAAPPPRPPALRPPPCPALSTLSNCLFIFAQ